MALGSETSSRLPAGERRSQLIETAIDLFSRKGFAGTTTKEIAKAAGVTEAIVFRHFATKQHLYRAILEHGFRSADGSEDGPGNWIAQMQELMEARDDEGLFRYLLTRIIAVHRERPQFKRLMLYAALEGQEFAMMHHNEVAAPIGKSLMEYIAKRQRAGALRKGDPGAILLAVAGMAEFYAAEKYLYRVCDAAMPDEATIDMFMGILMSGVRGPRAKGKKK